MRGTRLKRLLYISLFAVFTAVCSWITIPAAVPFTMQLFAVYAAVFTLGGGDAAVAVLLYIALGAVGMPVFSGFQGGFGVLLGSTGGYIIGFIVLCLVSRLLTRIFGGSDVVKLISAVAGLLSLYVFGSVWFYVVYAGAGGEAGFSAALMWCVVPFVIPDLLKLALAFAISKRIKGFIK